MVMSKCLSWSVAGVLICTCIGQFADEGFDDAVDIQNETNSERAAQLGYDCTQWPDLLVGTYGGITQLICPEAGGTIPDTIGQLTALRTIRLLSGNLKGVIPESIIRLSNLQTFEVNGNDLEGCLPYGLLHLCGEIDGVEYFGRPGTNCVVGPQKSCKSFPLCSSDSQEFCEAQLTEYDCTKWPLITRKDAFSVTSMSCTGNLGNQNIPTEIGTLTLLTKLDLENAQLEGTVPSEIGLLTKLNTMILSGNLLQGTLPSEISQLTSLGVLIAKSNFFVGCVDDNIDLMCKTRTSCEILEQSCGRLNTCSSRTRCDGSTLPPTFAPQEQPSSVSIELIVAGTSLGVAGLAFAFILFRTLGKRSRPPLPPRRTDDYNKRQQLFPSLQNNVPQSQSFGSRRGFSSRFRSFGSFNGYRTSGNPPASYHSSPQDPSSIYN